MARTTAVCVPLTTEQRELIKNATGEDYTEAIVIGNTDSNEALGGEVHGMDSHLVQLVAGQSASLQRHLARSKFANVQPDQWQTSEDTYPTLMLLR